MRMGWAIGCNRTTVTKPVDKLRKLCLSFPGATEKLSHGEPTRSDPERFFVPRYIGGKGWVGVRLDLPNVDWDEIAEIVEDAYRGVAPKKLIAELDARRTS